MIHPSKRMSRWSAIARLWPAALVAIAVAAAPACQTSSTALIGTAATTAIAVGVAAHERTEGRCFSPCDNGTICNPKTGLCEPIPCGGCPENERCDQSGMIPRCVPVLMEGLEIIGQAGPTGEARAGSESAVAGGPPPAAATPAVPVDDPPGCLRATHVYPSWPAPADYQPAAPLFFVRFNRPVDPGAVIGRARIDTGSGGWRQQRFVLQDSFLVPCPQGTCTDVFFVLKEPLAAGTRVTWQVDGAEQAALGPPCRGTAREGAYVYAVFRTLDDRHPVDSLDEFWTPEQVERTFGHEGAAALRAVQAESIETVRNYQARRARPDQPED